MVDDSFNSRSREGSDVCASVGNDGVAVSIRAPARGATCCRGHNGQGQRVSIRAPARGATLPLTAGHAREEGFNSRSREGSDATAAAPNGRTPVSIRAPARGATHSLIGGFDAARVSIRAPARGATRPHPAALGWWRFQFALPRGERHLSLLHPWHGRQFQFALPRGERLARDPWLRSPTKVSIRAPARGATGTAVRLRPRSPVSIRAPARGATAHVLSWHRRAPRFNSRSREGSDEGG